MCARVRREVWALSNDPTDKTLEWYAFGVGKMRARAISDHKSWRFQAAIHEYERASDPLRVQGEAMPSQTDQDTFWTQCQHGSWFFLPWHRMYLHYFESILRSDIEAANGPKDWALPYWNYSSTANANKARSIPPAFRNATLPNGSPNPLYVVDRRNGANAGQVIATTGAVKLDALKDPDFTDPLSFGFGGPETGFVHGGPDIGAVEGTPHGDMHVRIGGPGGWMSSFNTAALDPLFWLHHANIDRLWEVWGKRRPEAHTNPTSLMWLDFQFDFRDVSGNHKPMTPREVVDTTSAPLDYSYDDVADPFPAIPGVAPGPAAMPASKTNLVGATMKPFEIGPTPHRTQVETKAAHAVTAPAPKIPGAAPIAPRRTFVHFENLTSQAGAPEYEIYLGVPAGDDPANHPDKLIGRLPMFGLVEASSNKGPHAGSGLTYSLEITDVIHTLRDLPNWDPDHLPITFVPVEPYPNARVRVGRVSLYIK